LRLAAHALRAELSVDDGNEQGGEVLDARFRHLADQLDGPLYVRN